MKKKAKKKAMIAAALLCLIFLLFACAKSDDDPSTGSGQAGDDEAPVDDDMEDDDGDDDGDDDTAAPQDAVEVFLEGDELVIRNNRVALRYRLSLGRYSVLDAAQNTIIDKAEIVAISHVLVPAHRWKSSQRPPASWEEREASTPLGNGRSIVLTHAGDDATPTLETTFTLLDGQGAVLSSTRVINTTGAAISVGAIYPLFAEPPLGGLLFGPAPDLRVLTNGILNYLEFIAPIFPGTIPTLSNWSTLILNQDTGRSFSIGALSFETAQPVFFNAPTQSRLPKNSLHPRHGRRGEFHGISKSMKFGENSKTTLFEFSSVKKSTDGLFPHMDHAQKLHAACQYEPAKTLEDGESLNSETIVMDFSAATPFDALETYADRIKAWLDIRTWTERHPEIGIPAGWNSWSGSGSSGGYGTDINEEIIVLNMDFADRELRRWGMNYFQIDDGWSVADGDWQIDKDRFPDHGDRNGIEWILDRARGLGFQTGLWIMGFGAERGAAIIEEHPDWFADPWLGGLLGSEPALDLSNPAVQDYLRETLEELKSWGAQWIKLDFAYLALLTTNWYEENLTRGEFYRLGMNLFHQVLGEDVFLLNVAIKGWSYGLVDSLRLTLDTMPVWDGMSPLDPITNQGLKPMYRDASRWYWLHERVWINHPDLIFFRSHTDDSYPPLSLNESIAFATSVALQGGLVKIGDRLVDLEPDWVDALRRILPVHGAPGRPLDLLEREYPEIWSLPIGDFDEPYHIVGMINWGKNLDLSTLPYAEMSDEERLISMPFDKPGALLDAAGQYHAYEFWTESYLGVVNGELALFVPARTARVVALRPAFGRPQFLGTNRHVLGGVGVIGSLEWDGAAMTLSGTQEASVGTEHAPFAFHLAFFVPEGFVFDDVSFDLAEGISLAQETTETIPAENGSVLHLRFSLEDNGLQEEEQFSTLGWMLNFQGS